MDFVPTTIAYDPRWMLAGRTKPGVCVCGGGGGGWLVVGGVVVYHIMQ